MPATPAQDTTFLAALTAWRKLARPTTAQNTTLDNAIDVWLLARNPPPPPPPPPPENTWVNTSFTPSSGSFEWKFDAVPSILNADIVIGLSNGAASAYTSLAVIVRFATSGFIDVRNGGAYTALTNVSYVANGLYHFRVDVNLISHTYTVFVTPDKKTEVLLIKDATFRAEQAQITILNNVAVFGGSGMALLYRQSFLGPVTTTVAWTTILPTAGSNIIYVSQGSGIDSAGRGTQAAPVKTLSYAMTNTTIGTLGTGLRNNSSDQVLLKCGDTWTDDVFGSVGNGGEILVTGLTPSGPWGTTITGPILIGAYGTGARPLIKVSAAAPFATSGVLFTNTAAPRQNIIAQGLEFYAYTRDPANGATDSATAIIGINWQGAGANFLIEDCKLSFFATNIGINGDANGVGNNFANAGVRFNVIADAYTVGSPHSQGMTGFGLNGLVLEYNVFDHNGWNASVTGAFADPLNRNLYLGTNNDQLGVFRGNIFANSSAEGAQFRQGGTVFNNLFVANPIGFDIGHLENCQTTFTANVTKNVILHSGDIQSSPTRVGGQGINVLSCTGPGVQITDNIIAHLSSPTGDVADEIGVTLGVGVGGVVFTRNIIYDWSANGIADCTFKDNGVQGAVQYFTNVTEGFLVVTPGGGSGYGNGSHTSVPMTGPHGSGVVVSVTVAGGVVTALNNMPVDTNQGSGIQVGDVLTPTNGNSDLGGTGSGFSLTVGGVATGANTTTGNTRDPLAVNNLGPPEPFLFPTRTVETYNVTLGGAATLTAFMTEARKQSRGNWRTAYTADAANTYVRQGFNL